MTSSLTRFVALLLLVWTISVSGGKVRKGNDDADVPESVTGLATVLQQQNLTVMALTKMMVGTYFPANPRSVESSVYDSWNSKVVTPTPQGEDGSLVQAVLFTNEHRLRGQRVLSFAGVMHRTITQTATKESACLAAAYGYAGTDAQASYEQLCRESNPDGDWITVPNVTEWAQQAEVLIQETKPTLLTGHKLGCELAKSEGLIRNITVVCWGATGSFTNEWIEAYPNLKGALQGSIYDFKNCKNKDKKQDMIESANADAKAEAPKAEEASDPPKTAGTGSFGINVGIQEQKEPENPPPPSKDETDPPKKAGTGSFGVSVGIQEEKEPESPPPPAENENDPPKKAEFGVSVGIPEQQEEPETPPPPAEEDPQAGSGMIGIMVGGSRPRATPPPTASVVEAAAVSPPVDEDGSFLYVPSIRCGPELSKCSAAAQCFSHAEGLCRDDGSIEAEDCQPILPFCKPCFPFSRCGSNTASEAASGSTVTSRNAPTRKNRALGSSSAHTESDNKHKLPPPPAAAAMMDLSTAFQRSVACHPDCESWKQCYSHESGFCAEDGTISKKGVCKNPDVASCKICYPYSRCGGLAPEAETESKDDESSLKYTPQNNQIYVLQTYTDPTSNCLLPREAPGSGVAHVCAYPAKGRCDESIPFDHGLFSQCSDQSSSTLMLFYGPYNSELPLGLPERCVPREDVGTDFGLRDCPHNSGAASIFRPAWGTTLVGMVAACLWGLAGR